MKKRLVIGSIALLAAIVSGLLFIDKSRSGQDEGKYYGIYYGKKAPEFTLSGPDGSPVSLSEFRGRDVLLSFGYTSCPDICPTTLSQLNAVTQKLGDSKDELQVLFITIDPERDTRERLGEYIPYFNESFIGLTGSADEIKKVADAYSVFYEKEKRDDTDRAYFMNHTQTVYLIDGNGEIFLIYPYESFDPVKIASDVKRSLERSGTAN